MLGQLEPLEIITIFSPVSGRQMWLDLVVFWEGRSTCRIEIRHTYGSKNPLTFGTTIATW